MVICISKVPQYISKNDIDKWSNMDHLKYFSIRYKTLTSHSFPIPKEAWIGLLSRMKGFRIKLKLDNKDYKVFIDNVFDIFFTQDNYVPTFGAITSEKVYYVTKKLLKNRFCSNSEFEQLRNQLYSSDLFKKLER
jgi:hypothetical protein